MNQKTNWVQNPGKTKLIISFTVYSISIIIMFAAMTDFFTEPLNLKINVVLLLLNIGATITMIKMIRNYYKIKL